MTFWSMTSWRTNFMKQETWSRPGTITPSVWSRSKITPCGASDASTHVRWTKMMFFELLKGWNQYFCTQDTSLVQGICVAKSNPFTLWYFWPKNGSKRPKNGPKISWFGMVWFGLWSWVNTSWSELKKNFNFLILVVLRFLPKSQKSDFQSSYFGQFWT